MLVEGGISVLELRGIEVGLFETEVVRFEALLSINISIRDG